MVKGVSYTLEAAIASFIILTSVVLFQSGGSSDGALYTIRDEGFRCLKSMDDSSLLRPALSNATSIESYVNACISSLVNQSVSICRTTCSATSEPSDVETTVVEYYLAGYTDKDPIKVRLLLWEL